MINFLPLFLSTLKGERRELLETMKKNHGWSGDWTRDNQVLDKHHIHYTTRISWYQMQSS